MSDHRCIAEFDPACDSCVDHDETCGERCDRCQERTCSLFGPEPRACGVTCADCPCDCAACTAAREDARNDLLHRIQGENR